MMNLLHVPVVQIRTTEHTRVCTFPEVLAALAGDEVIDLPALRAHQTHAAYALFAQLAACALRDEEGPLPTTADAWLALLLDLSAGEVAAWDLVGDDLSKPAFLQPPVPEGTLADFSRRATPDALDLLVTSKNHDLKAARLASATPEQWLWALVSLQTMDGYPGRGYYGVFRMNGGFGNRAAVAFVPGRSWSARFRSDVQQMRAAHDNAIAPFSPDANGKRLLWLDPWDGTTSLHMGDLDRWCVEVCRRVRLTDHNGVLTAAIRSTTAARTDGVPFKGAVGDPWLPVDPAAGQALTVGEAGFNYRKIVELLTGKWKSLLLDSPAPDSRHLYLATLVRGQGKTDGWHERWIDVDKRVVDMLCEPDQRDGLVRRAAARIVHADLVRKCLYAGLSTLLNADGDKRSDDRAGRWTRRLDADIDDIFFPELWSTAEATDEDAQRAWIERLKELAVAQLESAIAEATVPGERRYRAIAGAERIFYGSFHKHFKQELAA